MKGLIDYMVNLECRKGHRFFCPEPEARVGAECGHENCRERLHRYDNPLFGKEKTSYVPGHRR